jgi:hypothetical protein
VCKTNKEFWKQERDCDYCGKRHLSVLCCQARRSGERHFGHLELVTWPGTDDDLKVKLGWGGCAEDESEELRNDFYDKMGGSYPELLKRFDSAFRWTCCGTSAGSVVGCDHHGRGKMPCACDFCLAGEPMPMHMRKATVHRKGLEGSLQWGPDPRSKSAAGVANWQMRKMFYQMLGGAPEDKAP